MGPDEPLVNVLESAATRHTGGRVRVAVAWARDEGVWWFLRSLQGRIDSISVIVGMNEAGTTVEALLRLLDAGADVTCVFKHPSQTFHPKIYWYSGGAAGADTHLLIVGSSNMTRGGLQTNFEASLLQEFDHAAPAIASLDASLSGLVASPYAHPVTGPDDVQSLLERGYLSTERQRVRQRRQQAAAGGGQPVVDRLPSSPPPPVARPGFAPMPIPFEIAPEPEGAPPPPENQPPADADPVGEPPLGDRFYVRTLTENDVRKLHGDQVGTFEPDLGKRLVTAFLHFGAGQDSTPRSCTNCPVTSGRHVVGSSPVLRLKVSTWRSCSGIDPPGPVMPPSTAYGPGQSVMCARWCRRTSTPTR